MRRIDEFATSETEGTTMSVRGTRLLVCLLAGFLVIFIAGRKLDLRSGPIPVVSAQTDTWTTDAARKQDVRLIETRDASGPPAFPVKAGDLLFFTNVGTSYGGTNPRNSVVVIDARA